ncbi:hypothetical protein D3C76_1207710 [compost metagenome]
MIDVLSSETDTKCARNSGFWIAAIWAWMETRIPLHHLQTIAPIQTKQPCTQCQEQCRNPCWNEVGNIIKPSGCPAEISVFIILISHHGIECIYCSISHSKRRATDERIEQWRNNRIDDILCYSLYRAAHNFRGI